MPAEKTHGDSIRWYNTGAANHGDAQTDSDASIGGHLSSTEQKPLRTSLLGGSMSADVQIGQFSGENGAGVGTIDVVGSINTLAYTAPGGSQGTPVLLTLGGPKVLLEDGTDTNKWVTISISTANAEVGEQRTFTLTIRVGTMFGFDKVTSPEQAAGDDNYRTHGFECHNPDGMSAVTVRLKTLGTQQVTDGGQLPASGIGTITTTGSFSLWPDSGWALIKTVGGAVREDVYYVKQSSTVLDVAATGRDLFGIGTEEAGASNDTIDAVPGVAIDVEEPSSQPSGAVALGADEDNAPAGATYSMPLTDAEAITVSDLDENEWVAIHAKRRIPAGATASTGNQCPYAVDFDAG